MIDGAGTIEQPTSVRNLRVAARSTILAIFALSILTGSAAAEQTTDAPTVLMMDFRSGSPDDDGVYKAVRAQLSSNPIQLKRFSPPPNAPLPFEQRVSDAAAAYRATLVFWVDDRRPCTLYFFKPAPDGGRLVRRTLNIDMSSSSGRYEVIAVAAADMIEALLSPRAPNSDAMRETEPRETADAPKPRSRKRVEIFAAYEGRLFALDRAQHGVALGLSFAPIPRLVLGLSYTQYVPFRTETTAVRLDVVSRRIELPIAARILISPLDFRLGLAWSVDLRSYAAQSLPQEAVSRPSTLVGVHALVPFVFAAWNISERIALFGRIGVAVGLNEEVAKIRHEDPAEDETVLEPLTAKLTYQLGFLFRI